MLSRGFFLVISYNLFLFILTKIHLLLVREADGLSVDGVRLFMRPELCRSASDTET